MTQVRWLFLFLALLLFTSASQAQANSGFTQIGTATATTFTDATCPNSTTCYYQVTAIDSANIEGPPATCSTTQACLGGNVAIVVMPNSGTHTVTLVWIAPGAGGTTAVSYKIYRHIPASITGLGGTVN